ncbi:hypothetical protein [Ferruginibacter profundus]
MKYLKFLLINIIAFSLLFFLISLLFPSQLVTSKSISVVAAKEKIAAKLNNTADWKQWNGFISGNATITNTANDKDTLVFSLENNSSNKLESHFNLYQEQTNSVLVSWALIEKLPWYKPWRKFSAMVLSKQVAAVMDSSLNNFKVQTEAGK